jgi:hypothetical protein
LKRVTWEWDSLNIIRRIARRISGTKFGIEAVNENADLHAFKEKPSAMVLVGIFLVVMSYIIGWPMIGLFGALSLYWKEPLIIIVGGPLLFVVAHLAFLAGVFLAGGKYVRPFIRWITRVTLKKLT